MAKEKKKHRHRYTTIIINSLGIRHQSCKCGEQRIRTENQLRQHADNIKEAVL